MTPEGRQAAKITAWAWDDPAARLADARDRLAQLAGQVTGRALAEVGDYATMLSRLAGTLPDTPAAPAATVTAQLAAPSFTVTGQLLDLADATLTRLLDLAGKPPANPEVNVRPYRRVVNTPQGPRPEIVRAHVQRADDTSTAAPANAAAATAMPEAMPAGWIPEPDWTAGQHEWVDKGEAAWDANDAKWEAERRVAGQRAGAMRQEALTRAQSAMADVDAAHDQERQINNQIQTAHASARAEAMIADREAHRQLEAKQAADIKQMMRQIRRLNQQMASMQAAEKTEAAAAADAARKQKLALHAATIAAGAVVYAIMAGLGAPELLTIAASFGTSFIVDLIDWIKGLL